MEFGKILVQPQILLSIFIMNKGRLNSGFDKWVARDP